MVFVRRFRWLPGSFGGSIRKGSPGHGDLGDKAFGERSVIVLRIELHQLECFLFRDAIHRRPNNLDTVRALGIRDIVAPVSRLDT